MSAADGADIGELTTMRLARGDVSDDSVRFVVADAERHFRGLDSGAGLGAAGIGGDFRIESPPVRSSMR